MNVYDDEYKTFECCFTAYEAPLIHPQVNPVV